MKNAEITNNEDILDSRDIQERFDYLTSNIQDAFSDAGRDSVDSEDTYGENQAARLSKLAHSYGEAWVYLGDDGQIWD